MNTETMTVHKALAELKTMDSRIAKAIADSVICVANKHSNQKIGGVPVDKYIAETMKPSFERVNDLIERRNAIKRAVVLSNASTEVTVAGEKYTVAEAIDMKNHGMEMQKAFMNAMRRQYQVAQTTISANSGEELSRKAEQYVISMYGTKDAKGDSAEIEKVKADYMTANSYELVDPVTILGEIKTMEDAISNFEVEVDAALSVSNAMTTIEVSY